MKFKDFIWGANNVSEYHLHHLFIHIFLVSVQCIHLKMHGKKKKMWNAIHLKYHPPPMEQCAALRHISLFGYHIVFLMMKIGLWFFFVIFRVLIRNNKFNWMITVASDWVQTLSVIWIEFNHAKRKIKNFFFLLHIFIGYLLHNVIAIAASHYDSIALFILLPFFLFFLKIS